MKPEAFEAQLRAARLRTFEPEIGIVFRYTLPSQFTAQRLVDAMRDGDGDAVTEILVPLLQEWSGVTQAMLQPPGVGSGDPAPFTPGIARIALADRPAWVTEWAMQAVEAGSEAARALKATAGNSQPSSTPRRASSTRAKKRQ